MAELNSPVFLQRNGDWWMPRCPSGYQAGVYTVVSDARNVDGYFIGDEIRNEVHKVTFTFSVILANELALFLSTFSKRVGGKFVNTVRFLDPVTDSFIEREMYVGDRDTTLYSMAILSGEQRIYQDVGIALVEV